MEEKQKKIYTTRSKTKQCYMKRDALRIENNDSKEQHLKPNQSSFNPGLSLTIPSDIIGGTTHNKNRVVTSRPLTVELLSMYRKEIREWHRKRKKNMLNRRRALRTKQSMATSPIVSTVDTAQKESKMEQYDSSLTNKQVTDDYHLLKIRNSFTDGSSFLYVVPGATMRDFLLNFKNAQFYRSVKSLFHVIPGNSGTAYYQFHWMTTRKEFDDTKQYDWRDNALLHNTTTHSLESMIYQIFDRLATTGDILLEHGETSWDFYPSIVFTKGAASHQKPHLDFPNANLMKDGRIPYILHLPLCEEGLVLICP